MLDALLGAAIMVVATTSLLYSIEVAERAFKDAGRYPLNKVESKLLDDFGLDDAAKIQFENEYIRRSWSQWGESGGS
jgi:hypothetical protein